MGMINDKVRDKKTGEIGLVIFDNEFYGATVYALPKDEFEVMGRIIARYKTRKGLWQRWEVVE